MARKPSEVRRPGGRGRGGYVPRVIVKFRDEHELPYDDRIEKAVPELSGGTWQRLVAEHPGLRIRPLVNAVKPERIRELVAEAVRRDKTYKPASFLNYFVIDCPGADPLAVAKAVSSWSTVEHAYYDPPGTDPVVNAADDPRSGNQGYLDPAPDGIDAEFAWGFPGGAGAGQEVIDLEQGWTLDHEDLNAHGATLLFGTLVNTSRPHGSSVLGEICAVDNSVGCVGIAPEIASVNVVSHSGNTNNVPNAIFAAVDALQFGGVLLLEVQVDFRPCELQLATFDAIRLATALGITVVEAAGNGADDLDTVTDAAGDFVLNRGHADFRDSGAIMVGAATSTTPHARDPDSNFGSRIDCYAWGDSVDTLTSSAAGATNLYTTNFLNTSAASPIITGAALVVQGIAEATIGSRFGSWQLRAILSDPATGTASNNPAVDRIGVMPNLRVIIEDDVLNLAQDIYLRDFAGDVGDAHNGPISTSPDIIVRPAAVADANAEFDESSGTANNESLGS
jgi:Subtilase family